MQRGEFQEIVNVQISVLSPKDQKGKKKEISNCPTDVKEIESSNHLYRL